MCEQNTLSKLYGNLPQTSSLWHRADRGTTRSARDPSGTTRLRTCPQDDIVFRAGGFAPCTPIRDCEHSSLTIIVQFGILFFHIQVCQQSDSFSLKRKATFHFAEGKLSFSRSEIIIPPKADHHSRHARQYKLNLKPHPISGAVLTSIYLCTLPDPSPPASFSTSLTLTRLKSPSTECLSADAATANSIAP